MLDFPNAPTLNQKYPTPAVPGVPTYTWDGEKWTTKGDAITYGSVRYDAPQTLTSPQLLQARQNICAAPFDAMAYNGLQLNGACEVDQINVGWLTIPSGGGAYVLDGWQASVANVGAVFAAARASSPFGAPFDACAALQATTKITTVAAGDYACIVQSFEGNVWKRLGFGAAAALPVTIGFWVFSTAGGTATATLRNAAVNRSCPINFAVPAGVSQYVTITFPPDVTGTWPITNALAAILSFSFACGTSLQGANGGWQAGNFLGTAGTSNLFAANGNSIYISGLTVFPGNVAPTAVQSFMATRPRQQELLQAQRYWFKIMPAVFFAHGTLRNGGLNTYTSMNVPVPMRAQPAIGWPGNMLVYAGDNSAAVTGGSLIFQALETPVLSGQLTVASSLGAQGLATYAYSPTAAVSFDARM